MSVLDNPYPIVVKRDVEKRVLKGDLSINVKDYGAKGDGITNDTAAIQAAINDAPNESTIWFEPGKTYALHGSINNNGKSIHLRSNNARLLAKTHAAQIDFDGLWGTVYPVSAVAAGTVVHNAETRAVLNLTVSGTLPYVRGQIVKVYADDVIPGARIGSGGLESRVGQFGVVYSSTSGNVAILVKELLDPLTTNIRVCRLNEITASIEGFIFDTDEALMNDGAKSNCVVLTDLVRPQVSSCEVRNSTAQAIQVNSCYAYRIKDVEIDESNDDSTNAQFGYGVLDNSSSHGVIEGLIANFVRHAYSDDSPRIAANSGPSLYGRTYNNTIINGTSYGASNSSWDTHAASQGIQFINCVALGSGGPGFGLRGRMHTISGGKVSAGRDRGIYAFSESGEDSDSWGHTIENLDIESPVNPILFTLARGTNTRETRKTYIDNVRIKTPNDMALRFVNATVNIGRILLDNVQMSGSSASTVKLENSLATIENISIGYKGGLANNSPAGITLSGASDLKIGQADLNLNGTTNGTRFANYIVSDSTSIYRINKAYFYSNPTSVADFTATHTDSYIDFVAPAGNGLGISSALISWSTANITVPKHQLSRTLSPHVIYAGNITSPTNISSLRAGRFLGQIVTIVNVGTAAMTIDHSPVDKITTLTGATITLNANERAQFYWDSATWRQTA